MRDEIIAACPKEYAEGAKAFEAGKASDKNPYRLAHVGLATRAVRDKMWAWSFGHEDRRMKLVQRLTGKSK